MRDAPERQDGYVPLEEYAILSDGRTVALVAGDGRIDWWPLPTLDSPPLCAAILDPDEGGHFALSPLTPFTLSRRYVPGTNVLETTYRTDTGSVRVTEALNTGQAGRLPWTELARRVEGLEGTVAMHWELVPGDRFGQARPWVSHQNGRPIVHLGDQSVSVVLEGPGTREDTAHTVGGTLSCSEGSCHLVAVVATDDEPLFLPSSQAVLGRLERTVAEWCHWSEQVTRRGRWKEAVLRSALALKSLHFGPSGAIAAAATTALPETIGGARNWDYRYSWVRDCSFSIDALIQLELHEEVHASISWLLGALRGTAPMLHVFYSLAGKVADNEVRLAVPGYRGSRPVFAGNSAEAQVQLGTFGDLFDTVQRYVDEGNVLDPHTSSLLADLANQCCDTWRTPDSGIWELDELQHYTISKIGCWVALDRAGRLADGGQLSQRWASRWREEAAEIKAWVDEHCWSEANGAYSFYAGTDRLDAAVLLAGRTGFDRGKRLAGTAEAVLSELARGPAVYRYSGMESEEGAFVACSFWLVDALARVGRLEEAARRMDGAVAMANEVGLLSEEIDPDTGAFLGNLPQGLSHLALINAAHLLERLGVGADEDGNG
ncbi:MAG: putative glycosyl hydrolase [Acidimicrobiaceae bacterium]|nr:putative glycosyl hydrolase [Acidimicrobiaceae bacterium]